MAYDKHPASIPKHPNAVSQHYGSIGKHPASYSNHPASAAGGNTHNVIGVGATVATNVAINSVGNVVQVGA